MSHTFKMSNCYSGEFASGSSDGESWIMPVLTLCIWISMMSCILYVIYWVKNQINSVYREIRNQQEEIMGYTEARIDKFIAEQNHKYKQLEEENAEMREYAISMDTKVDDLRSMLQITETMATNIQCNIVANHTSMGHRIIKLRCQSINDLHALEDTNKGVHSELLKTIATLNQRINNLEHKWLWE